MAGRFITFEGGEGAGKTTQINLLSKYLKAEGHDVIITREPGGTEAAEALWRCFIKNNGQDWDVLAQAMLVFTTRCLHVEELIKPALEQGKIVISDRFTDSTRVYQGLAGGLGMDKVEELRVLSIGNFEPDLTFIFDIDPQIGLSRGEGRDSDRDSFEKKNLSFHESLREGYLHIQEQYKGRCVKIDAAQSIEDVSKEIRERCLKSLG